MHFKGNQKYEEVCRLSDYTLNSDVIDVDLKLVCRHNFLKYATEIDFIHFPQSSFISILPQSSFIICFSHFYSALIQRLLGGLNQV